MNTYKGIFTNDDEWYKVTKNGAPFDHLPSLKIRNHSPDGFAWGYSGSGPSQLALAILLEETDKQFAEKLYMDFKFGVIANLPTDQPWELTSEQVQDWLTKHRPRFSECGDSDRQMFMKQDGMDAYGVDAPCNHCGRPRHEHDKGLCRPGSDW